MRLKAGRMGEAEAEWGDATKVEAAGKAFGALRRCLFASSSVSPAAKAAAYEGVVLAILLYGSESWCLTEVLLQQLRAFHGRCLRSMCRVTRAHTWRLRITSDELMCRLGLDAADFYVARRQLGWLGHVAHVDFSRLAAGACSPAGCQAKNIVPTKNIKSEFEPRAKRSV